MGLLKTDKALTRGFPPRENLSKAFQDKEISLFFVAWIKNNRNATAAYAELHPRYDIYSNIGHYRICATLGSRMLKKVDISLVLEAYDLGIGRYISMLHEGLEATHPAGMFHKFGDGSYYQSSIPDYKTRRVYHKVLGELLGIEKKVLTNLTQMKADKVDIVTRS